MQPYKLKLGVSGFVYPGGRKGENLFEKLTKSELSDSLEFFASGSGWKGLYTPKNLKFDEMSNYYHVLDMLLCTSTIEGIPIPPLEALAVGTPVIIPRGVGILDELPDVKNIYRYKAGNYIDMLSAISKCIYDVQTGNIDHQELRNSVLKYNIRNWAEDHLYAFENMLYNVPKTQNKADSSDLQGIKGIYTVAYGKPARNCFIRLLTSIRKHLGDIPVCCVSDVPIDTELEYQFIEFKDEDIGARSVKTRIYELAPKEWQYVLYLDSDTEIISDDALFLFDLLQDGFDCVFCINPTQYVLVSDMSRPDNQDEINELIEMLGTGNLLQFNGGVFGLTRNETTEKLFNGWHDEWEKYGKRDQAALDRVLYNLPVRVYTLGVEWNTVTRYYDKSRSAGILHFPLESRRWVGRIDGKLSEAWASVHPDNKPKDK